MPATPDDCPPEGYHTPDDYQRRGAPWSFPPGTSPPPREFDTVFLSFLRPPAAPTYHAERRSIPRHEPSSSRARVAWREIDFRFEKASVRLLDFSEKGARVLSSVYPRVGRTIWVGLTALPHEWVKAAVRSAELSGNQWVCRLEFLEPCSAGMLEIAFLETSRK